MPDKYTPFSLPSEQLLLEDTQKGEKGGMPAQILSHYSANHTDFHTLRYCAWHG